jgi:hypothetical protein
MKRFSEFLEENFPHHIFLKDHLKDLPSHSDPKKHAESAMKYADEYDKHTETNPQSFEAVKSKAMFHWHKAQQHKHEGKSNSDSWHHHHMEVFSKTREAANRIKEREAKK